MKEKVKREKEIKRKNFRTNKLMNIGILIINK